MPLLTYPQQPVVLAPDWLLMAGTSGGAAVTAGAAYLAPVVVYAPITITSMRTSFTGTPTGNCDMGIYDATGSNSGPNNLLAHTGAIAAATGLFTQNLTANLALSPGRYWIALVDTVADSIPSRGLTATGLAPYLRTSATNLTVLPSTIGTVANNNLTFCWFGLISGSWS